MKTIPLTQGKFALVDDWAYPFLARWKWQYKPSRYTGYAKLTIGTRKCKKSIYMHQLLMLSFAKQEVDHIDQNGLNNQIENLRIATRRMQTLNSHVRSDNTTGHKNISWSKEKRMFVVRMKVNPHKYDHIGYFDRIDQAIAVRDKTSVALRIEAGKDQRMATYKK
jgi:hypothetical protein